MLKWIKKYWMISTFALFVLPYIFCEFVHDALGYFLFHDPEKVGVRYYPINISQPGHITIEYETDERVKYSRCFKLHLRAGQLKQKIPALLTEEYDFLRERDKAIIAEKIKNKPQLAIKIYKKGEVINEGIVYMLDRQGLWEEWGKKNHGSKGISYPTVIDIVLKQNPIRNIRLR